MTPMFKCGHLNTKENRTKVGNGRIACKICRSAIGRKHDRTVRKKPKPVVETDDDTPVQQTPGRLALRRFSWEELG